MINKLVILTIVMMMLDVSIVYAADLNNLDANGNNPKVNGITIWNRLAEVNLILPAKYIGPGAKEYEIQILNDSFKDWKFKNGDKLAGNLNIIHYDAFMHPPETPPDPPNIEKDKFTLVYDNPLNRNDLRWIQFICAKPRGRIFDVDKDCPPNENAFIDRDPGYSLLLY